MSSPLVTFLLAQLEADQAAAEDAETACWHIDYCDNRGEPFHDRFNWARISAEVDAKRRLIAAVDALDSDGDISSAIGTHLDTDAIWVALVLPYADRDGYDQRWAPDPESDTTSTVPCPGAHCPHPSGHQHIGYGDRQGSGCVLSAEGTVIDLFDLTQEAVIQYGIRQRGRSPESACYWASFGMVHSRPSCRCPR
jgi:hypothetical protein